MYLGILSAGARSLQELIFLTENVNLTEKGVIETEYDVQLIPVNSVIMSSYSIRSKFILTMEIVINSGIF